MPFKITATNTQDKSALLNYFRERGNESLAGLREQIGAQNHKKVAAAINKEVARSLNNMIEIIASKAAKEDWDPRDVLRSNLTASYSAQVAMLDLRNEVWPYEYMAFSRRIGELWEQFVRIPFIFPATDIEPFAPPLFSEVRNNLRQELTDYIDNLPLSKNQKRDLIDYYEKVWVLVDSGDISLQLDFHAKINDRKVNIDFKSGFGSNEKGNTNRLLMVGTIYKNLEEKYENVLLVRAAEDQNNHYFQTLKRSEVWEAHCSDEAYETIGNYTGFNLKDWIHRHIDWKNDLLEETVNHLNEGNLLKYLEW